MLRCPRAEEQRQTMTAASVFHFLHIAVFAVIAGIELPAMYALRLDPVADQSRTVCIPERSKR